MDPPLKYSRSHKRLRLGMPKASPSSSTIISFSHGTIFLFLYTLCAVLGVSVCFYFQFVCVLFSGLCNKLDPCMLVWERHKLRFFVYTPILHLYLLSVQLLLFLLLALVFKHLLFRAINFCSQELLLLLFHPFSFFFQKVDWCLVEWKLSCRKSEKCCLILQIIVLNL